MLEAVSSLVWLLPEQPSQQVIGPDHGLRVQVPFAQLVVPIAVRRCQEEHPARTQVTGCVLEQRLWLKHVFYHLRGDHDVELPTDIVTSGMAHAHIKPFLSGNRSLAFVDLDADSVAITQVLQDQPMSAAKLEDAAWPDGREMAIDEGHLL